MPTPDEFSTYLSGLLNGSYDCVDRISLRGYFPLGQTSGGLLVWWGRLFPDTPLTEKRLRALAGDLGRRVQAYARQQQIPLLYCEIGDKTKHAQAEKLRPTDPSFQWVFAIFVAKAPALVWQARDNRHGKVVLRRPKSWPLAYHYHFHILDPEWGHITIRMSGHPQEGHCFVGGSDLGGINRLAQGLDGVQGLARLAQVVDRWVYSACLCFALNREQQERSEFRYAYSAYQLEYSRNLLFKSGRKLDEVYQGLIDRMRQLLDVPRLKTIFGRKQRPRRDQAGARLEKIVDRSVYDLTVFKLHFGNIGVRMSVKKEGV